MQNKSAKRTATLPLRHVPPEVIRDVVTALLQLDQATGGATLISHEVRDRLERWANRDAFESRVDKRVAEMEANDGAA